MLASPLCSSASLVYFWVLFSPLFLFQYLFCWMSCSLPLPAPTHPEHELRSSFMSLSWPWNRVPHAQLLNTKWVKKFRDWASNHLEKLNVPPGESSWPRDQTRASHISCSGMWILTTGATKPCSFNSIFTEVLLTYNNQIKWHHFCDALQLIQVETITPKALITTHQVVYASVSSARLMYSQSVI